MFRQHARKIITPGFEKDPVIGGWFCQSCNSESVMFDGQTNEMICNACGNRGMVTQEEIVIAETPKSYERPEPRKPHRLKPKKRITVI